MWPLWRRTAGRPTSVTMTRCAAKARLVRACGRRFVQTNKKYLEIYMFEDHLHVDLD
jgi:hypothetical protein